MDNMPENCTSYSRRQLLKGATVLAAAPLVTGTAVGSTLGGEAPSGVGSTNGGSNQTNASTLIEGRRRLGSLEVSSLGLGVQNMHRKYTTTVPYRPEMINVIRAAYEHGVTFFDTAEAYGPFENERILGEAIKPFRDDVTIT